MSQQSHPGFAMPLPGRPSEPDAEPADVASPPETLRAEELVDPIEESRRFGADMVLGRLDAELVGLAPVKTRIAEIASLLVVDRLRNRYGLTSSRPTLHMCFTGRPGTGKTTVALRMAELLHALGYLERDHLVTVTRDELVGQYIGHTAPKTKEVLKRAMGGVLFIDEAYYLYRAENERDYGAEAIEILLQAMETHRDDLVVILAGYRDRMDAFFESNPGMSSRVAHHLDFPDYSVDELVAIAELMLANMGYEFSPDALGMFRRHLEAITSHPRFANARSVRNALEQARLRQAHRLVSGRPRHCARRDLMRIEPEDIPRDGWPEGRSRAGTLTSAEPRRDEPRCA
jgi:probable Rubsico expression protein CbbX